jgi:hypothetical protein
MPLFIEHHLILLGLALAGMMAETSHDGQLIKDSRLCTQTPTRYALYAQRNIEEHSCCGGSLKVHL